MNKRIQELDAFRGIAALAVVEHHFTEVVYRGSLFSLGSTGVDLFFIISGYVIFLTINHTRNWQDFVVSRFARLYPTYLAAMAFTGILYLIYQPGELSLYRVAWNLTMLQSLGFAPSIDPSYWTLGVELVFYWLILILYRTKQIDRVEVWGALLMLALFITHTIFPILWWKGYNSLTHRLDFVNHAPFFFIGILFYTIQHKGNNAYRYILLALCFLLQTMLHYKGCTFYSISKTQHVLMMGLYVTLFYLFILGRMRWIVNPVTLYFGKISYSLYLLHHWLGKNVLLPLFKDLSLPFFWSFIFSLLICILLATAFNRYIEIPTNDYVKKWYKTRQANQQIMELS